MIKIIQLCFYLILLLAYERVLADDCSEYLSCSACYNSGAVHEAEINSPVFDDAVHTEDGQGSEVAPSDGNPLGADGAGRRTSGGGDQMSSPRSDGIRRLRGLADEDIIDDNDQLDVIETNGLDVATNSTSNKCVWCGANAVGDSPFYKFEYPVVLGKCISSEDAKTECAKVNFGRLNEGFSFQPPIIGWLFNLKTVVEPIDAGECEEYPHDVAKEASTYDTCEKCIDQRVAEGEGSDLGWCGIEVGLKYMFTLSRSGTYCTPLADCSEEVWPKGLVLGISTYKTEQACKGAGAMTTPISVGIIAVVSLLMGTVFSGGL